MTAGVPSDQRERLRRVFELELERGCGDRTVIGGLDRMLIQMLEDGDIPHGDPLRARIEDLPRGGYRMLVPGAREAWLRQTVAVLSARPPKPRAAPARRSERALGPDDPIARLPGIGKAAAERMAKLGVETVADAARFFPRRFNDFTDVRRIGDLEPSGQPQTVKGTIMKAGQLRYGRRVRGSEVVIADGTGSLRIIWFNMPYVGRSLSPGDELVVSGRPRVYRGRMQMENPEYEPFEAETMRPGRLVPVYPATQGLSQRVIRRAVATAVEAVGQRLPDPVPAWLASDLRLPPFGDAVVRMHQPENYADAEKARQRLAFGELLAIQAAVLQRRAEWQQATSAPLLAFRNALPAFLASLPFALTGAQQASLDEILDDIARTHPMLRLLQGDVGSGKTVVAFAAMLAAVASGRQAALMAPTEILAEQHFRSLTRLLGGSPEAALEGFFSPSWFDRPVRAAMLTGSVTASRRRQVLNDAMHGGADIIIGTHALLEDDVVMPSLGLAVIDEQHRFGVNQRTKLRRKGDNPHLLVMTATPIPRTLALTVYGDLEVSTIDELPPGRKPIATTWVEPHERDEAYVFLRTRLDAEEQVYVICPLVEDSDAIAARSAEEEYDRLRNGPLRNYRLGLLHGRMPGRQKDEVMTAFANHELDALVSTSVIEVGIDVPNATVMVIEGAERFGLSQMHQFRGRVGRSAQQSYCMLFSSDEDPGPEARQRLEAMEETTDGFRLAEVDLEMRGEGEAWGQAQSGFNSMLRVARLTDRELLLRAREAAGRVIERDPLLQRPEHRALAAAARPILSRATEAN